ncbi:MAG TPA: PDZ domain-containing protein [Myxococcaceae bacterium]|nr:PDZ domain-containing protein [Myxococcaceae bacterium]
MLLSQVALPSAKAIQAEIRQMLSPPAVAPGLAADAGKVEQITPPVDGWVAARVRAPYREFPNVVLFHQDGGRWARVPEGLALGLCDCTSGIMDLHTGDSESVLDMTLGREGVTAFNPRVREMMKEINAKGGVGSLYGFFLHVHPAGKATYFLDKTWLDGVGPKLIGPAYLPRRRRDCFRYDALPLQSIALGRDGGEWRLTAQSLNDQRWTVRWTGLEEGGWLAEKAVDAEVKMTPGSVGAVFIESDAGLVPAFLTPGSPAHGAFRPGDVVEVIDGQPVTDAETANQRIMGAPGSKVRVGVVRDGQELTLTLVRAAADAPAPAR